MPQAAADGDADGGDVPLRTGWEDAQLQDGTWNRKPACSCSRRLALTALLGGACAALGVSLLVAGPAAGSPPPTSGPPPPPSGPPPPPPSPSAECLQKTCGANSSWDLDDGPCVDARDSPTYLTAYERTLEFAKEYTPTRRGSASTGPRRASRAWRPRGRRTRQGTPPTWGWRASSSRRTSPTAT